MIEAGAKIVPEDVMGDAIEEGFKALKELNDLQEKITKEIGKAKTELAMSALDEVLKKGLFRNKSHIIESSVKKFLEDKNE